jgi:hypothetical protein
MVDGIKQCYFCQNTVSPFQWRANDTADVECSVCGPYRILAAAGYEWHAGKWHDRLHVLSGTIRNQNERGINVLVGSLDDLGNSTAVPEGPLERIDHIVMYLLRKMKTYDAAVTIIPQNDYSVAYTKNPDEFKFLLNKCIELGYVEEALGEDYRLTLKGWQHASELDMAKERPRQAFVAMSFNPVLNTAYSEGIKAALETCGYFPLRIDRVEHNDQIDDQIVAGIRSSGLLVADFTGHRQGVYFELGFAMGLGIK